MSAENLEHPPVVHVDPAASGEEDVAASLFDYLDTDRGHAIATRVLEMVDEIKRSALSHSAKGARLEKFTQFGTIVLVVAAATVLAIYDKFNASVGLLFGTLVGFVLGKKSG